MLYSIQLTVLLHFWLPLLVSTQKTADRHGTTKTNHVVMAMINPNSYRGGDGNYEQHLNVIYPDNSRSSNNFSLCLWLHPTRYPERSSIISLFQDGNNFLSLSTTYDSLYVEGLNDDIKLDIYEWHHVCLVHSPIASLYFNKRKFSVNNLQYSNETLVPNNRTVLIIGADNVGQYSFSGMIADVRLYLRSLEEIEVIKIFNFRESKTDFLTISNTIQGIQKLKTSRIYVPNNDYLQVELTLGILLYYYKIEYLIEPRRDYLIYFFPEKVPCVEAVSVCSRFNGFVPDRKGNMSLNSLRHLIDTYTKTSQTQITNFWMFENKAESNACIHAFFSSKTSSINVKNSTLSEGGSPLCVVRKNTHLFGKLEFDISKYYAVPNTFHVYDNIWSSFRVYFDSKYAKMIYKDMRHNRIVSELALYENRVSDFIGRHKYSVIYSTNIYLYVIFSVCTHDMFTCSNGICTNMSNVCNYQNDCEDASDEEYCEVGIPPSSSYEKRVAPATYMTKSKVHLNLTLSRIDSIKLDQHTIKLMLNVKVSWVDHRLKFKNLPWNQSLAIDAGISKHYWQPKITIYEGIGIEDKHAFNLDSFPSITYAKKLKPGTLKIMGGYETLVYEGTDVYLSHEKRETVNILCNMDLFPYPFDSQECTFTLHLDEIIKKDAEWDEKSFVGFENGKGESGLYDHLQFYMNDIIKKDEIKVTFAFNRKNGAYLLNTFLPFVILEIIGLLTLLMPCDDYQDRVTVTLSCLIVMATLYSQASSSLPISADPKIIDYWMFVHICLLASVFFVHLLVILTHHSVTSSTKETSQNIDQLNVMNGFFKTKLIGSKKATVKNESHMQSKFIPKQTYPNFIRINFVGLLLCAFGYVIFLATIFILVKDLNAIYD